MKGLSVNVVWLHAFINAVLGITLNRHFGGELHRSLLEMSATRWDSCSSCLEKKSDNPEQIKLQLQDFNDNVDFHMNHFISKLKDKFDALKVSIDPSEAEHLKQACDSVEDKVRETQAHLKNKCQDVLDSLERKLPNRKYREVAKVVEKSKELIKMFVKDGIESLKDDLNKLKKEFAITAKSSDSEHKVEKSANDGSKDEDKTEESTKGISLVDLSILEDDAPLSNGKPSKVDVPSSKQNITTAEKAPGSKRSSVSDKTLKKDSVKEGDEADAPTKDKSNGDDGSKKSNNNSGLEGSKPDTDDGKNEDEHSRKEPKDKDKIYEAKSQADLLKAALVANAETRDSFDLAQIPATAVTRAVQSYLKDLSAESAKLMDQVRI